MLGVDLVGVAFGGVECHFGGRQLEDQPPLPGIHPAKPQDVAEKRPIRLRIVAIEKYVGSVDHPESLPRFRVPVLQLFE
jgi:hypothetical protein